MINIPCKFSCPKNLVVPMMAVPTPKNQISSRKLKVVGRICSKASKSGFNGQSLLFKDNLKKEEPEICSAKVKAT